MNLDVQFILIFGSSLVVLLIGKDIIIKIVWDYLQRRKNENGKHFCFEHKMVVQSLEDIKNELKEERRTSIILKALQKASE